MSLATVRKLLVLALVAGGAYWLYRTRPTVSGFIDDLTRPLFGTKAVVEESEHKRIESEVVPAVGGDEAVAVGALHEKMTMDEVRETIGSPDEIERFRDENGEDKVRWIYRRLGRVLVFQEGRVLSIAVR